VSDHVVVALVLESGTALGLPPEEIDDVEVDASANEVTRLLVISVRDDDAARAADLANGLAEALAARIKEQPIGSEGVVTVIEPASVPR
jgi:capsular polysaccharide biosynthesis protein